MLGVLLQKDWSRALRNPAPYLIHLALPLVITALLGLAFGGGGGKGQRMGRIQMAIVDEDGSPLTEFLRGALSQREVGEYLDVRDISRVEAMGMIEGNQLSVVVIIPEGFVEGYLRGERVGWELIKNPAQTYYPAIVEEVLGLLTLGLDGFSRGLRDELPVWSRLLESGERWELLRVAGVLEDAGKRMEGVRPYVYPPLVQYREAEVQGGEGADGGDSAGGGVPFAFLLAGLAGVFLLFVADRSSRDFFVELERGTLARFHTLRERLWLFVLAKEMFVVTVLWVASVIILWGGAWLFGFSWRAPWLVMVMVMAYGVGAGGLMTMMSALAGSTRRADLFNSVLAMSLGLAGGCMFPPQQLPAFLREHVSRWLPTHWFADTVRRLQAGEEGWIWAGPAVMLVLVGVSGLVVAACLSRRRIEGGAK
jgi:ABC-2 type transport system permease protein